MPFAIVTGITEHLGDLQTLLSDGDVGVLAGITW